MTMSSNLFGGQPTSDLVYRPTLNVIPAKVRGFEKVAKYAEVEVMKPIRKTDWSAGYDMAAAHDVVIQPLGNILNQLMSRIYSKRVDKDAEFEINKVAASDPNKANQMIQDLMTLNLDEIKAIVKEFKLQPTLISTGHKAYMQPREVLELAVRSSCPLNAWIILANPPGEIDADYYNNPDNEGEIFFQVINLSPVPLHIKRGDVLGQGIFKNYLITDDDHEQPKQPRKGGLGSTSV